MKQLLIIRFVLLFTFLTVKAQTHIDKYIQEGLNNNESIKQQKFLLDKSLYALKEAKSLYLPNLSLGATYTVADGGRTIDFPVGDLVNPIYSTLNTLTGTSNFQPIDNQSFLLNPNDFYDVKLQIIFPIINSEIIYNKKIKAEEFNLQKTEIDIYKRELVKEIKTAYYKYLQSDQAVRIHEKALLMVQENLRVNKVLFNNQMVNKTVVLRSENEVEKILAQVETAKQSRNNARAYFNFLLNKPNSTEILSDSINTIPVLAIDADMSTSKREELIKLNQAMNINQHVIGLAKSSIVPKLNSFVDAGSQGYSFAVNKKTPYYIAGLSLEWSIFSGGKDRYKMKQAKSNASALQSQTKYVAHQLQLQMDVAVNNYKASMSQYYAAKTQVVSSNRYYSDLSNLYKQGQSMYIELLDAQNQLVSAQLQENISLYDTWIKQAEIERANASFNIK